VILQTTIAGSLPKPAWLAEQPGSTNTSAASNPKAEMRSAMVFRSI